MWSEKNEFSPYSVSIGSEKKIYVRCLEKEYHPDYLSMPALIYNGNRCPYCAHKKIHPKDSFAQYHIEQTDPDFLNKYWVKENEIDPFKIPPYKNSPKVKIKCQKYSYHVYEILPSNFTLGNRCPYCAEGKKKTHYLDSVGFNFPKIQKVWSEKNIKSPFEYRCNSHFKAWFKCAEGKHEDYQRAIKDYARLNIINCPMCVKERKISFLEEKVQNYIMSLGYSYLCEYNCTILPINPKTNFPLPYDNEIIDLKLIIEVHGIQHYELSGWHITQSKSSGRTPEEEFEYQKEKDLFKKNYALSHGYYYLEIPYWTIEEDNYINLINDKINVIKSSTLTTAG